MQHLAICYLQNKQVKLCHNDNKNQNRLPELINSANRIQQEAMTDANPITNPKNNQILAPLRPRQPSSYTSSRIYIVKILIFQIQVMLCFIT